MVFHDPNGSMRGTAGRIGDRLACPCEPLVDALEQKEPTPVRVDGFVEQHRFEAFGERLRRTHRHHQEIENAR